MKPSKWCSFVVLPIIFVAATQDGLSLPAPSVMKAAVEGLLTRLLDHRGKEFIVEIQELTEGRDYFKISGEGVEGRPVRVWSDTGVGAALGVMTYLKYLCHASVAWEANHLSNLPAVWPKGTIEHQLLDRYQYYGNPCVFSYSYAFWSWQHWEREIDLMALMGVNLALALNGQEAIWRQVYLELGLTEEELQEHFAGYAFLAWNRMGNIERWGGPLSLHWQQEKLELQTRIVARMRELGMLTVLPAFSGHVPKGILRVFPNANVTRLPAWGHFSEPFTGTYLVDSQDPLFERIGVAFIKKMVQELGTDHFYLVDPFNEMTPVTPDLTYLQTVSQNIYGTLRKADPSAIWVTQGWMFFSDKVFWQKPQAKAYLTAVPQGKMLILDLTSEVFPQYNRLESYFGQPFIFCLLNNYGGVRGMYGNVDVFLKNLEEARQYPNTSLVGTGMTPEGIGSNYIMFDLLSEMSWRRQVRDVQEWAAEYSSRRYGVADKRLEGAWKLLMSSIYNSSKPIRFHSKYTPLMLRPRLRLNIMTWYPLKDLMKAWDLLTSTAKEQLRNLERHTLRAQNMIMQPVQAHDGAAAPIHIRDSNVCLKKNRYRRTAKENRWCRSLRKERRKKVLKDKRKINMRQVNLLEEETFKYDLIEVTREIMQVTGVNIIKKLIGNYRKRNIVGIESSSNQLQELIHDLNTLLGSNSAYLLGSWVQSATNWANNTQERSQLRSNALYQISLWGPNGEILDYAVKQWNGVMQRYVAPRWDAFATALLTATRTGQAFNATQFKVFVFKAVEKPFTEDQTAYPSLPYGDPIKLAIKMHNKYRPLFPQRIQS